MHIVTSHLSMASGLVFMNSVFLLALKVEVHHPYYIYFHALNPLIYMPRMCYIYVYIYIYIYIYICLYMYIYVIL